MSYNQAVVGCFWQKWVMPRCRSGPPSLTIARGIPVLAAAAANCRKTTSPVRLGDRHQIDQFHVLLAEDWSASQFDCRKPDKDLRHFRSPTCIV